MDWAKLNYSQGKDVEEASDELSVWVTAAQILIEWANTF
jgi:hypothetical protein